MAQFAEFAEADDNRPVWVNPEHVRQVRPDPHRADLTEILVSNTPIRVKGKAVEVVAQLATGHTKNK